MNVCLIASTSFEINASGAKIADLSRKVPLSVSTLISGVGLMAATHSITREIERNRPDILVQAGVAGSFSPQFAPGSLVVVSQDLVADTCVKEPIGYRHLTEIGLQPDVFPYRNGWLENKGWSPPGIPSVKGITVNEISTNGEKTDWLREKYGAVSESMEGAALHFAALSAGIPFLQLRAISNMVGERDKGKWQLKEAVHLLNEQLPIILENMLQQWNSQ
jgi:futalosine hydrolase